MLLFRKIYLSPTSIATMLEKFYLQQRCKGCPIRAGAVIDFNKPGSYWPEILQYADLEIR